MTRTVTPNWKKLLVKARNLVGQSNVVLYERTKLLKEVFEDPEFKRDCLAQGKRPTQMLDELVNDTCTNFVNLLKVLKQYPNKEQWKNGNISQMLLDAVRSVETERNGEKVKDPNPDKKMSWKQRALKAEEELREVRGEMRMLQGRYDQLQRNYDELRQMLNRNAS